MGQRHTVARDHRALRGVQPARQGIEQPRAGVGDIDGARDDDDWVCLQLAALAASVVFASGLVARGGHVLKLSPAAYGWAIAAGLCIGLAEIGYFYLFRGVGGAGPMNASVAVPVIVTGTVVLTLLLSSLVLNESLGTMQVAGTVVVVIGIAMIFFDRFAS